MGFNCQEAALFSTEVNPLKLGLVRYPYIPISLEDLLSILSLNPVQSKIGIILRMFKIFCESTVPSMPGTYR